MSNFEIESLKALPPCHPQLVEAIITQIKSQGLFDDFRKSCLSDIDTKPSYLNLKQRVEGYVNNFLSRQQWSSALQRNQLRETLRKDLNESGLLKTGLDHLVDQSLYAHAEKSIRPKVRAEIRRFLNLTDAADQHTVACVPHYPMAGPPHYGPPAMPPLPPVPPPPDVTGAMMDSFGISKPPEPPSPHGSEYSVDMSDASMVGRDEAPPAIPSRSNAEKLDLDGRDSICNDSMDVEEREEENQGQTPLQCSSPEIFEEVSEGGSLGGTPVRDEDALDSQSKSDNARTDFTGLFKDGTPTTDLAIVNDSEVIMDEESMVFEVSEEYVKTEELAKNDEGTGARDEGALSSHDLELEQTDLTPILDEAPADDDAMQISSDDETQCEDEVQSPREGVKVGDNDPGGLDVQTEQSSEAKLPIAEAEEDLRECLDPESSNTQPPLQIDTEDTEFTVIEKNRVGDSHDEEGAADVLDVVSQGASGAYNDGEPASNTPDEVGGAGYHAETVQAGAYPETEKSPSGKSDSEKPDAIVCDPEEHKSTTESKVGATGSAHQDGNASDHTRDSKHKERRSSSHQANANRSEGERDRRRGHKSSSSNHHTSSFSSTSSKSRKSKDHEQSRGRDRDSVDKRDDRKDRERDRRKERDSKSHDRDRAQRDSKHRSSSHGHRKHSRHHQTKQKDDERKVSSSTSSSSNRTTRDKNEETRHKPEGEKRVPDVSVDGLLGSASSIDNPPSNSRAEEISENLEDPQSPTGPENKALGWLPESSVAIPVRNSSEPPRSSPVVASASSEAKGVPEDDAELESEVPLKRRKRKVSKHHDSFADQSRGTGSHPPESKEARKETPASKGRRRSSAASVTSVELLDQPESPVPSKFGRQRKINPKYEDDGTLSALLFGKMNS